MPRDNSGNYGLPAGNPVVSGEVIESEWANSTLDDVALALSNSLDRDGNGGMRAPLVLDGSVPTDPDHATDKKYVDGQDQLLQDQLDVVVTEIVAGANVTVDSTDPQRPIVASTGEGGTGGSPLTTKGDLYGFTTVDARIPVAADGYLITSADAAGPGVEWAKLKDIPLDPDDPGAGFPGGSGTGITRPTDTPVPVGGMVTYADTAGDTAQGNPAFAILGGQKLTSVDGTTFEITPLLGGGITVKVSPGDGGASLDLIIPVGADAVDNPIRIYSAAAALDVQCDGKLIIQGMHWDIQGPLVASNDIYVVADETRYYMGGSTTASTPTEVASGQLPSVAWSG